MGKLPELQLAPFFQLKSFCISSTFIFLLFVFAICHVRLVVQVSLFAVIKNVLVLGLFLLDYICHHWIDASSINENDFLYCLKNNSGFGFTHYLDI